MGKGGGRDVITRKVEFNEDILSRKIFDEDDHVFSRKPSIRLKPQDSINNSAMRRQSKD